MTPRPEREAGVEDIDLRGTTVLVTGATSGVGRETALALGRMGADVLVHGRNRPAGEAVVDALRGYGSESAFLAADFTSIAAVRNLADDVRERCDQLDVLVNNAGAYFRNGKLTVDGIERTIAVNHVAPFVLTSRLLESMPRGGRVVTVSSSAHRGTLLELDGFESVDGYDGLEAYRESKLANVLFTKELARRTDRVTANCCHPGLVPETGIWREASPPVSAVIAVLSRLPRSLSRGRIRTAATAAETSVYLAASPDLGSVTGQYFSDCSVEVPDRAAFDEEAAALLWEWSADVTGLAGVPGDRTARHLS